MLTARGYWFVVVVAFILALGVIVLPIYTVVPAILGITLLAWFAFEWVLFQVRVNAAAGRLKLTRRVVQGGREVPMVWAGLAFEVRVRVGHDGPARIPFAVLEDRLPPAAGLTAGDNAGAFTISSAEPARLRYTLLGPAPGALRFEGVKVRLADLHGFFYHRTFLRDETEYLILPPLGDDEGRQRADKRFNTLPPPGVHRLRRPGSGSELLDLRDYRPGDPPKMIAWKASARRDRLITKEYESDVPVRCVLFLDTSDGMRLGPPGATPLARMAGVAAGVAQAAAGNRDLVGLTTFDEADAKAMPPARTKIHTIGVLRRLAEVASLQPGTDGVPAEQLTRRAYPLAQELYPELMSKRVNAMPLGRLWLPLLDRRYGWVVLALMLAGPVGLYLAVKLWIPPLLAAYVDWARNVLEAAAKLTPNSWNIFLKLPWLFALFVLFIFPPVVPGAVFWFLHGARGWFGQRRVRLTHRKRLSAVLALSDGTGPAGVERLIHDDDVYAARVGRFLQERQVRVPVPLYDDQGRYRYRCGRKTVPLAAAMVRAVGRARDNELYVILADLAELGPDLTPLLKAARAARARHHHVMVIVPWPADLAPPDDLPKPEAPAATKNDAPRFVARHPSHGLPRHRAGALLTVVRDALTGQYHEAYRKLRRAFSRVGATVVRVDDGDPIQLVLDRLDRLRGMRSRR